MAQHKKKTSDHASTCTQRENRTGLEVSLSLYQKKSIAGWLVNCQFSEVDKSSLDLKATILYEDQTPTL